MPLKGVTERGNSLPGTSAVGCRLSGPVQSCAMNGAYWHLLLNHFPPIFAIAALFVLFLGVIWRNDAVLRVSFILVVVTAVVTFPVFRSGGAAEHVVKTMDGINRAAIEPHQEAANATFVACCAAGVVALFALIRYRAPRQIAGWMTYVVAFFVILATVSSIYTSLLGGRIHHPETQMRTGGAR